ncbi:MAG TPA: hypothetical protein VGL77_15985 [Armatimonadota bacterium]|jgi:hypothetical protein
MAIYQQCDLSFTRDDVEQHGTVRIEQTQAGGRTRYQAIVEGTPLHGTYGGFAESVELALDFLNLALQAEGADAIHFACHPVT